MDIVYFLSNIDQRDVAQHKFYNLNRNYALNLADHFDKSADSFSLDVNKFAELLYLDVNGKKAFSFEVKELDI